jgi:stearoyl-CoA desaturase (delta-9 desaturase)
MTVILIFLILHWYLSLTLQTLFLHRYASHGYYSLSSAGEKVGHILTWLTQGSSYLSPYAYGILHKAHHSFSDTDKDPHSPHHHRNPVQMMLETAKSYSKVELGEHEFCNTFTPSIRQWKSFDQFASSWISRSLFGFLYFLVYYYNAPHWSIFLLLPIHFLMGPIHGFIVNWFGHWAGYRNFKTPDQSKNSLPIDFFLMGELYQNNHHSSPNSPCFAKRWWEVDFGYLVLCLVMPVKKNKRATRSALN